MSKRACTVRETDSDAACTAGAKELGVKPSAVRATERRNGSFDVEVVDAPFLLELAVPEGCQEAVVERAAPAVGNHPSLTKEAVLGALSKLGVTAGVLEEEIDALIARVERTGNELDVVIARGQAATNGRRAQVVPTRSSWSGIVRDGETIAAFEPAVPGTDGFDVRGKRLEAEGERDAEVTKGRGVEIERDRWVARVAGVGYLEQLDSGEVVVTPVATVGDDRMQGFLDLRPPSGDEPALTLEEVLAAIQATGIVDGVDHDRIEAAWGELSTGALGPIEIAAATRPLPGADARIVMDAVESDPSSEAVGEPDRVDHRALGSFVGVSAGERLGVLMPATVGMNGTAVDGSSLAAPLGADDAVVLGEGVRTGGPENGGVILIAELDGVVVIADGTVSVVDLLVIQGDVDYATGNIDVDGSVRVDGSIRSGFTVTARYNVTVAKSIEDAVVEAGGDVVVGRGILGGEQGRVVAGKLISADYTQNASIRCAGDVVIKNSDSNSDIECDGQLIATAGRGSLRSGRYIAAGGVVARELGSALSAPTMVSVGVKPEFLRESAEIEREFPRIKQELAEVGRVLKVRNTEMTDERARAIRTAMQEKRALERKAAGLNARLAEIEETFAENEPPTVDVLGRIHPRVEIIIRGVTALRDGPADRVRFRYDPDTGRVESVAL